MINEKDTAEFVIKNPECTFDEIYNALLKVAEKEQLVIDEDSCRRKINILEINELIIEKNNKYCITKSGEEWFNNQT